jgi:hypothetical protein
LDIGYKFNYEETSHRHQPHHAWYHFIRVER